jgi:hypothetical protein
VLVLAVAIGFSLGAKPETRSPKSETRENPEIRMPK